MNIRLMPVLLGGSSLLSSTSVFAHASHSVGTSFGNLLHLLTGAHHAPVLLLAGTGIVYLVRKNHRSGK